MKGIFLSFHMSYQPPSGMLAIRFGEGIVTIQGLPEYSGLVVAAALLSPFTGTTPCRRLQNAFGRRHKTVT